MDPLQSAKSADLTTQCVIFGYIHEMESKLKMDEVAPLIINIILGFYHCAEFIDKFLEDHFRVSPDKLTITNIKKVSSASHTIYLNQWIHSMSKSIVKWTFKINQKPNHFLKFYFGITTEENEISTDFACGDILSYAFDDVGFLYEGLSLSKLDNSFQLNIGDLITFTLDLKAPTFTVKRADDNEIELFEVETSDDIKYKFVLQMGGKGMSVTLVNFEINYASCF